MPKQITLKLPEWANWIAQDSDGPIWVYKTSPYPRKEGFYDSDGQKYFISERTVQNENWRDSKININTHGAYIDADGILHKCELKDK